MRCFSSILANAMSCWNTYLRTGKAKHDGTQFLKAAKDGLLQMHKAARPAPIRSITLAGFSGEDRRRLRINFGFLCQHQLVSFKNHRHCLVLLFSVSILIIHELLITSDMLQEM